MTFLFKIKSILFLFLFFQINVSYAQNTKKEKINCTADFDLFNELIRSYRYDEALVIFKKVETNKCKLIVNDYYNAACIYSVLNNSNLALKYLNTAIKKEYYDTAHMAVDKDLDNIRNLANYKNLVAVIKRKLILISKTDSINEVNAKVNEWTKQFDRKNNAKWQFLKSNFTKINLSKIEDVIPYKKNNKWGFMDKLGNALTKPLFEFADFSSANGLLFIFDKKYFFYNKKGGIDKLLENNKEDRGAVMRAPVDNYYELTNTPGFVLKDNQIVSHSSDYVQIDFLDKYNTKSKAYKNYLQDKTWAIVKNKERKIGIIDSVGNTLNKAFNFEYTMDRYGELSDANYRIGDKVFYVLKNEETKLLFELNGNSINTVKPISNGGIFYWDDNSFGIKNFIIYSDKSNQIFKIHYIDLSQNLLVLKNENLSLAFTKFYNEILGYNGVCKDKFEGNNFYKKDIKNLFALVKEGNEIFYVDMDGKEYKLRD